MCCDAFDAQRIFAHAFARSFDRASQPGGRFQDEHSSGLFRQCFGNLSRRMAAHFFIGNQKNRNWPGQCALPALQRFDGMEHERNA